MFLHGTAGHPAQWGKVCDSLAGSREYIRPELPSHIRNGRATVGASIADEARLLVRDWMLHRGPVHLVGHSYGGAVALRIALDSPEHVRSLTLIEPAVFHLLRDGPSLEQSMFANIATVEAKLREAASKGYPAAGVASFFDFWCGPGSWDRLTSCKRAILSAQADLIIRNFAVVFREDTALADYGKIACPVLGVAGTGSPCLAQHLTRMIVGHIEHGKMITITAAGHMSPLTHPRVIAAALAHHFSRSDRIQSHYSNAA